MQKKESVRFDLMGRNADIEGTIVNGRTFIRARRLLEELGYNVGFENGVVIVSEGKGRTPQAYIVAIDSFNVESNPRYANKNGQTFCNFFAQDVMKHLNTSLPSGRCVDMFSALDGNKFSNWVNVSFEDVQTRVNLGFPGIAISAVPNHIAVIRPNNGKVASQIKDILVSQAGKNIYACTTLNYCWRKEDFASIKFYSWFDSK
jgi:hypothetical protein